MHMYLQWRIVTGTFTSRIMQNCSKICTETWDTCGVEPLGFPWITPAASPNPRSLLATQPHWLPGHEGLLPGKNSWSYSVCHRGECRRTGISRGWMGNIAFQTRKKSPSQKPGGPRGVEEPQAADPLAGCFPPFAERWMFSALWASRQLFTRNSVQYCTSS